MTTESASLGPATVTLIGDRELVIERTFQAPRARVFEAITKREHVQRWYGLRAHTMTACEIDLRVGGRWRYVMREPGGQEFAFSGEYRELDPPARLVSTELFESMPGTDYLATVTLDEVDGRTLLRSHLVYQSPEHRTGHIQAGMEWGMNETYNRLEELLAAQGSE